MNALIRPLTKWPAWLVILGAAIWAIYNGIYPDLNPQHLQLVDAAVWILTYLLGLIGVARYAIEHMKSTLSTYDERLHVVESSLAGPPTRP